MPTIPDMFKDLGPMLRSGAARMGDPGMLRRLAAPHIAAMARVMPFPIGEDDDDGETLIARDFPPRRVQRNGTFLDPDYVGICASLVTGSPGTQDAEGVVTLAAGAIASLTLGGNNSIGAKLTVASMELYCPDLTLNAAVPLLFRVSRSAGKPLVLPEGRYLPIGRIYRHPAMNGPGKQDTVPFNIDTTTGVNVSIINKGSSDLRFILSANP